MNAIYFHRAGSVDFVGVWLAWTCTPAELNRAEEAAWIASQERLTRLLLNRLQD